MDLTNGLYVVEMRFKEKIKNGLKLVVMVRFNTIKNALVVPNDALIRDNNQSYLWIIENELAKKVLVKSGISNGEETTIIEGIKENELVAIYGKSGLRDGSKVNLFSCHNCN